MFEFLFLIQILVLLLVLRLVMIQVSICIDLHFNCSFSTLYNGLCCSVIYLWPALHIK